jgi:hypothetical protein
MNNDVHYAMQNGNVGYYLLVLVIGKDTLTILSSYFLQFCFLQCCKTCSFLLTHVTIYHEKIYVSHLILWRFGYFQKLVLLNCVECIDAMKSVSI